MGVALLDSSAVIGYLYADDALHHDAVEAIESAVRGGSSLAISAVSWAELLNGAAVSSHEQVAVREFVTEFGVAVLAVDADVAERAAALQGDYAAVGRGRVRPRLRTPDALILATAAVHGAIEVVAGDAKWAKVPGVGAPITLLHARGTP